MTKRRTIFKSGKNYVCEIEPEGGWQTGRRGIRRTLCKIEDVEHMKEFQLMQHLAMLRDNIVMCVKNKAAFIKKEHERQRKTELNWTINQTCKAWLEELEPRVSRVTKQHYKKAVDIYIQAIGNKKTRDITHEDSTVFLHFIKTYKHNNKYISAPTQNRQARSVNTMLRWAFNRKNITRQLIKIPLPSIPQKDMETYTIDDLKRLKAHILDKIQTGNEKKRLDMINMLRAFMLATQSVMRLGPIWSLKLECINLKRRTIHIMDNPELDWKNKKNKWPIKPINDILYDFLKNDLKNRNPEERYYLDKGNGKPWRADKSSISKLATTLCKEIGLPNIKPFHWGMRATMITYLLNNNIPISVVQQLADHDDIQTTMLYRDSRRMSQMLASSALPEI